MRIPNINCKHYSRYGRCKHPIKEKSFFFFRPECKLLYTPYRGDCIIQEKFEKQPIAPPPPPATPPGPKGPPPRPPKREYCGRVQLDKKEIKKRVKCLKDHQEDWKVYTIGRPGEGRASFAVCAECGARHLLNDVIQTQEDIDRKMRELGI